MRAYGPESGPKVLAHHQALLAFATAHFVAQFQVAGHEADMLSLITSDSIVSDRTADHAEIARRRVPTHFCYTTDDPEMPRALVEETIGLYTRPSVAAHTGGHFMADVPPREIAEPFMRLLDQTLPPSPNELCAARGMPPLEAGWMEPESPACEYSGLYDTHVSWASSVASPSLEVRAHLRLTAEKPQSSSSSRSRKSPERARARR